MHHLVDRTNSAQCENLQVAGAALDAENGRLTIFGTRIARTRADVVIEEAVQASAIGGDLLGIEDTECIRITTSVDRVPKRGVS